MPEIEDDKTWPPAPSDPGPTVAPPQARPMRTPYLTLILVMWGVTITQFVLQGIGLGMVGKLFGLVGFVLAAILVSRRDRAAAINGGLRLAVTVLGILVHLLDSR